MNSDTAKPRVLVVEDQESMRALLKDYLEQKDFEVSCCDSVPAGLKMIGIKCESATTGAEFQFHSAIRNESATGDESTESTGLAEFDAVLTDIKMPGMDGLQFCRLLNQHRPGLPVIVMTAYGSMETAVEALRAGAFDFVTKPVELELIKASLSRATENSRLKRQIRLLESQAPLDRFGELIGESEVIVRLKDQLARVVDSSASVLLTGESGSGKEVAARALHSKGDRANKPFVAINCAALPESLLESELFGHVKGAFTDARENRQGLFMQANGGTLFLDEIGEMPLEMQPKLLRAIEQKTVRPIGGKSEQPFDVRLITATNRDLEELIETKRFREDLYYRINVLEITIPPLRTRGMDVLRLANHFLKYFARQANKAIDRFDEAVASKLLAYDWPGNVRELRNVIERAVVLSRHNEITLDAIPQKIVDYKSNLLILSDQDNQPLAPLDEIQRRYIRYVLDRTSGNKTETAKILGLDRKTLYRKLKEEDVN